jgi:ribosome-binding factor A
MESERLKRLSSVLQQDLAEIFVGIGKKYFKGVLLSVTKVRITPDLSVARVYISIFPMPDKILAMETIENHHHEVKQELARRTRHQLRKMPELRFHLDDSLDYEEDIDRLLRGEGENPIK